MFILTICFLLLFQIWWRIRCLSVFLSFCVLSTPVFPLSLCPFHIGEEGNKKVFHSCPKYLQTSSDYRFLHAPVCSFRLSSCLALLPCGPVELLLPYQPNHTRVAAASRALRIVSGSRLEQAGGDTGVFQTGGSKKEECALVSV